MWEVRMRIYLKGLMCAMFIMCASGISDKAYAQDVRLAAASESRDVTAVQALLGDGADVNGAQPDGATALHWAAHWNDLPMVEALIAAASNVDAANDYGVTPLSLAATNGSAPVLDALLRAGASADAALLTGETALMTAVRSGSLAAVRRLLEGGADPNARQASKGQTALMWAATAQQLEIAQLLIDNGGEAAAAAESGFTALMFAAREGGIELAELLLESGADINAAGSDGNTALLVATVRGHAHLAIVLLERGAEADGAMDAAGYSPLHWATSRSESPISFGDVTSEVAVTGEWGAMSGIPDRDAKLDLVRALIDHGANLEASVVRPPQSGAIFSGSAMMRDATPYFVAAMAGDAEIMRLLQGLGADPFVLASNGSTALIGAIRGGNAFTARAVTEQNRIDAVASALEAGHDLEAQDENGYRAMHVAAEGEFQQLIRFLLENGAELNPVTQARTQKEGSGFVVIAGQSPLGIVEGTMTGGTYNERPETAAFLRELGAESIGRATLQTYLDSFEEGEPDAPDVP
jgi:ankyrin repeat protein